MSRFVVLTPDAQYHDDGEVENTVLTDVAEHRIRRITQPDQLDTEELSAADALLVWHVLPINAELVEQLTRCRIIVRAGVGFDHIDLAATGRAGIPVCNVPDYGTAEVADHAIALMLGLRRGLLSYHRALVADPVGGFDWGLGPLVRRNRQTTFGVLGVGRIGTATALRAKAFGCRVIGYDPELPHGQEIALGIERIHDLYEFLAACDVVSIHCPLSPETRHLLDERAFAAMRPDALLINTARGAIVDLDALYEALKSNRIAGAGIDVFADEPANANHPFWQALHNDEPWLRERVIVTPHAAWYSPESQHDARRLAAETLRRFIDSGELRNCVNRAYLG